MKHNRARSNDFSRARIRAQAAISKHNNMVHGTYISFAAVSCSKYNDYHTRYRSRPFPRPTVPGEYQCALILASFAELWQPQIAQAWHVRGLLDCLARSEVSAFCVTHRPRDLSTLAVADPRFRKPPERSRRPQSKGLSSAWPPYPSEAEMRDAR